MNKVIGGTSSTGIGCSIDGTIVNKNSNADDMVLVYPSVSVKKTAEHLRGLHENSWP